jgi:hypothetical protein
MARALACASATAAFSASRRSGRSLATRKWMPCSWFAPASRPASTTGPAADINRPAESIWLIEEDWGMAACPDNGDWIIPEGGGPDRHTCGNNWIYCDSHARWAKLASTLAPWDAWNDKEGPNRYLKDLPKHNKVTGCQ